MKKLRVELRYRREGLRRRNEHGRQHWPREMFCDESHFTVTSNPGHQLLRREMETCSVQHYVRGLDPLAKA